VAAAVIMVRWFMVRLLRVEVVFNRLSR